MNKENNHESIIKETIIDRDLSFIITGSSGWIGRALLDFFYSILGSFEASKRIFPISNSKEEIFLRSDKKIKAYKYDFNFEKKRKYHLFHLAYLTKDKLQNISIEDYKSENNSITKDVLEIIKNIRPEAIFFASSGAVYNNNDMYSELKRIDERVFLDVANISSAKIIIPRIFNIAGPYINKISLYAIGNFIFQAMNGNKIFINSNFPVLRSYIHIFDIINISLMWMLDSKSSSKLIYDTGNKEIIELNDLANKIIRLINKNCTIERPIFDTSINENSYLGNIDNLIEISDKYHINLSGYDKMIEDTYKYIVEIYNINKAYEN